MEAMMDRIEAAARALEPWLRHLPTAQLMQAAKETLDAANEVEAADRETQGEGCLGGEPCTLVGIDPAKGDSTGFVVRGHHDAEDTLRIDERRELSGDHTDPLDEAAELLAHVTDLPHEELCKDGSTIVTSDGPKNARRVLELTVEAAVERMRIDNVHLRLQMVTAVRERAEGIGTELIEHMKIELGDEITARVRNALRDPEVRAELFSDEQPPD